MENSNRPIAYGNILVVAALVFMGWFVYRTMDVLFLFALAMVAAIALNFPVRWLEKKRVPRSLAVVIICVLLLGVVTALAWIVVPLLSQQISALVQNFPVYLGNLSDKVTSLMKNHPEYRDRIRDSSAQALSALPDLLGNTLKYSFSAVASVIFGIIFFSIVVYMLLDPRPFLRSLVVTLPVRYREPAADTFVETARTISAWVFSCLAIGGVEAVVSLIFLLWIGVPGAVVWAVLACFSEIIPRLGFYLMAIPPTLVGMSISFSTGIWVFIFYISLNEIVSNTLSPWIRSRGMEIHPVICLFITLAMASAFGLPGAIIALPLAGFLKAAYLNFYLKRQPKDPRLDSLVEKMMISP